MKTVVNNNESLINLLMVSNPNKVEAIRDIYECSMDEQNYGPEAYECKDNPYCTFKDYIQASEEALERAIQMEHMLLRGK